MTSPQRASSPAGDARVVVGALAMCLVWLCPSVAWAAYVTDRTVVQAEVAYDASNYAQVVQLLGHPDDIDALPAKATRIKAFKLLAFSYFFLKKPTEAHESFFGLLKQDPDYQLDRVLDPPAAIDFFEEVRRRENGNLAPIRLAIQKDREEEDRRKRREKEAMEAAEEIRRLAKLQLVPPPQIIERKVSQSSVLVAWMPFGLGQFQNGHTKLGTTLAITQTVAALTSVASFLSIEALRESDGRFTKTNYAIANRFDIAKWVSAGLFYALWMGGAIDANARFVPERIASEAPSAAPTGPLTAPAPVEPARSTVPTPLTGTEPAEPAAKPAAPSAPTGE